MVSNIRNSNSRGLLSNLEVIRESIHQLERIRTTIILLDSSNRNSSRLQPIIITGKGEFNEEQHLLQEIERLIITLIIRTITIIIPIIITIIIQIIIRETVRKIRIFKILLK